MIADDILFRSNEKSVATLLWTLIETEKLAEAWDLPPIAHVEWEFPLPRGRADLVLFHADGSVSVVELKRPGKDRDILAAIGQVTMYAIQMGYAKLSGKIRRIIAAPIAGKGNELLAESCRQAGVVLEPLGTLAEHEQIWREAFSEESKCAQNTSVS